MTSSNEVWTSDSSIYLQPQDGPDAWTTEAAAKGGVGTQRLLRVEITEPPAAIRQALALAPDATAALRLRLIELDGQPVEIASSWYPADIAAGTPLTESKKIRGGAPTLLASLGHRVGRVVEDAESRLPTAEEAQLLGIESGQPVLVLTRLSWDQEGRPFEVGVMIAPGNQRRLRYEMKVS